jgi:hypothetical protein
VTTTVPLSGLGQEIYNALVGAGLSFATAADITAALSAYTPTASLDSTYATDAQVTSAIAAAVLLLLTKADPTFTGAISGPRYKSAAVAVAAANIDHSAGSFFTKSVAANLTLTESNRPASGPDTSFRLDLAFTGAFTLTLPATWILPTGQTLTPPTSGVLRIFGVLKSDGTGWAITFASYPS